MQVWKERIIIEKDLAWTLKHCNTNNYMIIAQKFVYFLNNSNIIFYKLVNWKSGNI